MSGRVQIFLDALVSNFNTIKNHINNSNVKICATVKSNAYGHGLQEIVSVLHKNTIVDYWGVGTLDEAIQVKKIVSKHNIICYAQLNNPNIHTAILQKIELFVGDEQYLKTIEYYSKSKNITTKVHLVIETGMGRLGFFPNEFLHVFKKYSHISCVEIVGICSHLSNSSDKISTKKQKQIFDNVLKQITVPKNCIVHIANSGAIIWNDQNPNNTVYYDMVRPGIMLYGYSPNPSKPIPKDIILKPTMKLVGQISSVRRCPKGQGISYMSSFVCDKDSNIAVVNVGYGDGLVRSLGNCGVVGINNKCYPIVGDVCMDMIMINLGDDDATVDSEVTIFGDDTISINEQATLAKTIPYVLSTQITQRPHFQYYYK